MKKIINSIHFFYLLFIFQVFNVVIYSQFCTVPNPVSPLDGATVDTLFPSLCYSYGTNFQSSKLEVSTSPSFIYPLYSINLTEFPGCKTISIQFNQTYWWRIGAYCYPGYWNYSQVFYFITAYTGLFQISSEIPESFSLSQNYPNPFNPTTKIRFSLPNPSKGGAYDVKLIVYDIMGSEVASLISVGQDGLQPGTYEVDWDAGNFSSGVYYYTLTVRQAGSSTGDYFETKKMALIK